MCSGAKCHDFLAYETEKIVRIRNAKVGILYYSLVLLILLYVVFWAILYQKRYLSIESPVGSVRSSLRRPCLGNDSYHCDNVEIPDDYLKNCKRHKASELPYCDAFAPKFPNSHWNNYQCEYWDENIVHYPSMENDALFATSRMKKTTISLDCDITDPTCVYEPVIIGNKSYIAEIERFTVQIDHSIYSSKAKRHFNAMELEGHLKDCKGKKMNMTYPNIVGQKGCKDTFEIQTLMEAACINSLDSESIGEDGINMTKRDRGLILIVFIHYSNTVTFNLKRVSYTIEVVSIDHTQYKADQTVYTKDITNVLVIGRHGIRIVFLQSGTIGKFDFQELLLTFVSGFGLVAVATIIVDILATRFFSWSDVYGDIKYENSPVPVDDPEDMGIKEKLLNHSD